MIALSIASKEFRLLLREKGTFFWLIVLPILFIVLFGSVFGSVGKSSLTLPYINQDQTMVSQSFLQTMANKSGFKFQQEPSSAQSAQITKIHNGKQAVLLVIPKGFAAGLKGGHGQATIELYRDAADTSTAAPVFAMLENTANEYREGKITSALVSSGMSKPQLKMLMQAPFRIVDNRENAATLNMMTQIVPGYTVMFVFFIIISMVRRFISDKESGMTARLSSTRMTPLNYLIGNWIPYVVVTLIQCVVLLAFGHFVYGLHLGDLFAVAAILIILSICVTGFGLALSLLVRSENQGMAITQLITMGGAVVGGLWFLVDLMLKFMQVIGQFTPQYWAQKGLQDIMIRGSHLAGIWPALGALTTFAVFGLLVALLRFKRFMRTAMD